jgi:hypothetical protein
MSLNPSSYEEAKAHFKPMKRKAIARKVPKPKKKKKVKVRTLKNKAWAEFSIFIRQRGADHEGFNTCVTCGTRKPWKELQAGHFIAGRLNSNLFDERGCNAQCSTCNVIKAGNGPMYYKFMLRVHGQEIIDELLQQNDQTRKWLPCELESLAKKYAEINSANLLNSS